MPYRTRPQEEITNMGVRLNRTQRKKLDELARAAGKPASVVVRDLIEGARVITRPQYAFGMEPTVPVHDDEKADV